MSESESEYSDTEVDEQSVTTANDRPPISIVPKETSDLTDDEEEPSLNLDGENDLEEEVSLAGSDVDIDYEQELLDEEDSVDGDNAYNPVLSELDSSSEEDNDEDEDYYQKFDKEVLVNHMEINHPESRTHNYDEVRVLSTMTRDKEGNINDVKHKTLPFLTKFEKAKILGIRAKQIDEGAIPFVKVTSNLISGYTIATMELMEKKIPFIIRRPLPNGSSEYWKVSDLEIIN